jgi:hypothetical protein
LTIHPPLTNRGDILKITTLCGLTFTISLSIIELSQNGVKSDYEGEQATLKNKKSAKIALSVMARVFLTN